MGFFDDHPSYDEERTERNKQLRRERMAAARAKGQHTLEQWIALVLACGERCVRCGHQFGGTEHPEKDHITPLYQGGSDGIENLQPLCRRCNASKGPEAIDYRPAGTLR